MFKSSKLLGPSISESPSAFQWPSSSELTEHFRSFEQSGTNGHASGQVCSDKLGLVMIVNGTLVYGTFHKILKLRHDLCFI